MNGMLTVRAGEMPMLATFEECAGYTRIHAKSFYFSSYVLPREKRRAAYAVYAFCRFADDIIDHLPLGDTAERDGVMAGLREHLNDFYDDMSPNPARFAAFRETVRRYAIPKRYFEELLDGVSTDLQKTSYASFEELDTYCYKVASVVGLVMSEIFGYSDPRALRHAADLGTAMQLTNILRDIKDDARLGRIYLPQDEMLRFEYTPEDLRAGVINENFKALMKFQIERARGYYRSANEGIQYLTDDGSRTTVVMMSRLYAGILDRIEQNGYDVFSERRYVSTLRKIALTGTYVLEAAFRRFRGRAFGRHEAGLSASAPHIA